MQLLGQWIHPDQGCGIFYCLRWQDPQGTYCFTLQVLSKLSTHTPPISLENITFKNNILAKFQLFFWTWGLFIPFFMWDWNLSMPNSKHVKIDITDQIKNILRDLAKLAIFHSFFLCQCEGFILINLVFNKLSSTEACCIICCSLITTWVWKRG